VAGKEGKREESREEIATKTRKEIRAMGLGLVECTLFMFLLGLYFAVKRGTKKAK